MKKIIFYVPLNDAGPVKEALFDVGAGCIGNYEKCSFEVRGVGQFKPLQGAKPTIGKVDQIEQVDELRVEMICEDHLLSRAISELKKSHPYEEPAIDILELYQL